MGVEPVVDPVELPLDAEDFLVHLAAERGRAVSTLAAYRRDLLRYWDWLRTRRGALIDATEADVLDHLEYLRQRNLAPATVKRAMVAVRGLHRFLGEEARAPDDPGAFVKPPPVARGLPKALTEAEVTSLIDAVTGSGPVARRDRAILEVLYGTGIRISELVGLSLPDVDLDQALMRVLGKGGRERIVPVGRLAREALREWLAPSGRGGLEPDRWRRRGDAEAVFLNQRGGRLSRQGAWLVIRQHGDRIGLGDRLTPHVLRHSCATHLLDHGADIRSVQELLGHRSISTTQVYTLVSNERLVEAYRRAHPRSGG